MLRKLIESFDDDQGLNEKTYEATRQIIELWLGYNAYKCFSNHIDATDGRFYSKISGNELADRVFQNATIMH